MSINQDFQAVIPVGDGYVVVAEMFDREQIKKIDSGTDTAISYVSSDYQKQANDFIDRCGADVIRKVVTSIKTGALYDMYQNVTKRIEQNTDKYANADALQVTDLLGLVNILTKI
jgi:hypothetical protein